MGRFEEIHLQLGKIGEIIETRHAIAQKVQHEIRKSNKDQGPANQIDAEDGSFQKNNEKLRTSVATNEMETPPILELGNSNKEEEVDKEQTLQVDETIAENIESKKPEPLKDIVLDNVTYKPDELMPRKLAKRMTKCAEKMETKIRLYLKVFRTWTKNNNAENFQKLEKEIWWVNTRISTWMASAYDCDFDTGSDDEFHYE